MKTADIEQPELILLVGIPGVGKSTWIQNHIAKFPEKDYIIISSDDEVEKLAIKLGLTYNTGFRKVIGQATSIWKQKLRNAITNRKNIIVDMTNLIEKRRRNILNQAKGYKAKAVVWSLTDAEWSKRFNQRKNETGKHIPLHDIKRMANQFSMPTKAEGFEKITIIHD